VNAAEQQWNLWASGRMESFITQHALSLFEKAEYIW